MIGWCTEAEDSCLGSLHIPELSILADLALCFRKLILRNSFVTNRSWLRLDLVYKALVVDLDGQHFWVLIRVERVFINELLLRGSWALTIVLSINLLILAHHAILGSVTLACEDSFLLWSVSAPFNGNDHLSTLVVFLVNGIVSVHLDYLTYLDCWVANITILVVILFQTSLLILAIIWPSKEGGRLRIGSLFVIVDMRPKRIASRLWPFLGTTVRLLLTIVQSLASITSFSVHFLLVWEWMHPLTFYSWVLAWFGILTLNSICTKQLVWMWSRWSL